MYNNYFKNINFIRCVSYLNSLISLSMGGVSEIKTCHKHWKFQGGRGVTKAQTFKATYEAKLEFPEGWGS